MDWLLTGEGNMLNEDSPVIDASLSPSKEGVFFTETTSGAKFYDLGNGKYRMTVKLVPYCAYGRFANVHDTLEQDRDDWEEESFEVSQIAHGNYLSFEVKNDSMDDGTRQSFEAGDRLLVRELNRIYWKDKLRYTDHPYWVIAFGSSVLIKQIVSQDMERGVITLHSLNPSPNTVTLNCLLTKFKSFIM
ncbi:S24 family peptidase [Parabacteroides chongii]|uniref:S24 family peptidase n=1 Tax=Parabacteroides chongii TaxID=2685834 RepID=UPI00240D8A0E|nr:S24 family peptidase [Parabacteroides chongii]WFE84921.1 S24 family peptidase [Parabacteroides chongii]